MIEVFENRIKQVADEEFTDSGMPGWPILRADGSGWPLLSPSCLHLQTHPLASVSRTRAEHSSSQGTANEEEAEASGGLYP